MSDMHKRRKINGEGLKGYRNIDKHNMHNTNQMKTVSKKNTNQMKRRSAYIETTSWIALQQDQQIITISSR